MFHGETFQHTTQIANRFPVGEVGIDAGAVPEYQAAMLVDAAMIQGRCWITIERDLLNRRVCCGYLPSVREGFEDRPVHVEDDNGGWCLVETKHIGDQAGALAEIEMAFLLGVI